MSSRAQRADSYPARIEQGAVAGALVQTDDLTGRLRDSGKVVTDFAEVTALGSYQATSEKDSANGYAGLTGQRTTKGVDAQDDIVIDLATKGLVLKDTASPAHYWRVSVSILGVLTTTDLGTVRP